MSTTTFVWLIRACTLLILALSYSSIQYVYETLSPQGCKMSRMTPSYVVQTAFNETWTPLATRYSLSLYREAGFDPIKAEGIPVLFIPGNAGSSHQVRSIASSATRQYYHEPLSVAPEFVGRGIKPLDFYAVDFNEDLSAFHGPTLDAQTEYTARAIQYILSLYPQNTTIVVMGHSMGGVVATSLLPSNHISAVITMSTPHTLPPARFDSRIDKIYRRNQQILQSDPTPILSLCGGARDMMIPSESCVLPTDTLQPSLRKTVFASGLEGAWTGVGHREMVWCHQVRWRVARAALELGAASSIKERNEILDQWMRDGHTLPPAAEKTKSGPVDPSEVHMLEDGEEVLRILRPKKPALHLIPLPLSSDKPLRAMVFVSFGSFMPYYKGSEYPLRVSVLLCSKTSSRERACNALTPDVVRRLPYVVPGLTFPIPEVGSDESEGITAFEATIPNPDNDVEARWLAIRLEGTESQGWIWAGLGEQDEVVEEPSTLSLLFKKFTVRYKTRNIMRVRFSFPHIKMNALLAYKAEPARPEKREWCSDPLLVPLLVHQSQPTETHHYPLNAVDRISLLHAHTPAPYIPSTPASPNRNLEFTIYSSSPLGCNMNGLTISIDWSATLGRVAARYFTTVVCWSIGVVGVILFNVWRLSDRNAAIPSVTRSLASFHGGTLPSLLLISLITGMLPIPAGYYLGTVGEVLFAPLAPLLLLCATGLVSLSWLLLQCILWPIGKLATLSGGRRKRQDDTGLHRSTIFSMLLIFTLIFVLVPWQVAYLGCWVIHCFTCASSSQKISIVARHRVKSSDDIPLHGLGSSDEQGVVSPANKDMPTSSGQNGIRILIDNQNHSMHLLLLMTWLLPLVAPVLAVWVRTLATAGFTTPFDGDHDFWNVAPFLILVDFASRHTGSFISKDEGLLGEIPTRWCWLLVAVTAVFVGPTQAFRIVDVTNLAIAIVVLTRVGKRYLGGGQRVGR